MGNHAVRYHVDRSLQAFVELAKLTESWRCDALNTLSDPGWPRFHSVLLTAALRNLRPSSAVSPVRLDHWGRMSA